MLFIKNMQDSVVSMYICGPRRRWIHVEGGRSSLGAGRVGMKVAVR